MLIYYTCALPVVFSSRIDSGRAAADHLNYHEPVIHTFARQWPAPDLSNYHSATTPLYHLLLAGAEVAFGPSRRGLMLLGSVFTAGLLGLLAWSLPARTGMRLVLMLPLLGSMYVLFPGIWLLPDNAGWLGVLGVLLLALRCRSMATLLLAGGCVLVLLVLTRQIHIWAAGVIWAAAWLGMDDSPAPDLVQPVRPVQSVRALLSDMPTRLRRLAPALLATLPAFAVLAYFIHLWGGVVVPRYQQGHHGGYHGWNPATAAFFLSIVGSLVPFYAGFVWDGLRRLMRTPMVLAGVILLAVVLTVVPETTYDASVGRKSGLWNLVKVAPVIADHTSLVLLILAPLGAVGLASLLAQVRARAGWIYLGAMVAFVAAQTASPQLWQRYHEPFVLMVLALMCAEVVGPDRASAHGLVRTWRIAGPMLLGVAMGGLTVWTLATSREARSLDTGDFQRSVEFEPLRSGDDSADKVH